MLHIYPKIYCRYCSFNYDWTRLLLNGVKIAQPKRVFWANVWLFDHRIKARKLFKKIMLPVTWPHVLDMPMSNLVLIQLTQLNWLPTGLGQFRIFRNLAKNNWFCDVIKWRQNSKSVPGFTASKRLFTIVLYSPSLTIFSEKLYFGFCLVTCFTQEMELVSYTTEEPVRFSIRKIIL